jgi:restriction system protein
MWVCRAGQKANDFNLYMRNNKIYIPWEGYNSNYGKINDLSAFRKIVAEEKKVDNRTTISNWSSQIYQFVNGISVGDYVLIPGARSHFYHLAKVSSDYIYSSEDKYHHSRNIELVVKDIPREIFDQRTQYSLGAYRTLFKAKNEEYIIDKINQWKNNIAND